MALTDERRAELLQLTQEEEVDAGADPEVEAEADEIISLGEEIIDGLRAIGYDLPEEMTLDELDEGLDGLDITEEDEVLLEDKLRSGAVVPSAGRAARSPGGFYNNQTKPSPKPLSKKPAPTAASYRAVVKPLAKPAAAAKPEAKKPDEAKPEAKPASKPAETAKPAADKAAAPKAAEKSAGLKKKSWGDAGKKNLKSKIKAFRDKKKGKSKGWIHAAARTVGKRVGQTVAFAKSLKKSFSGGYSKGEKDID